MKPRALAILVIGLALAGCAQHQRTIDLGPTVDRDGASRSLVLSSPEAAGDPYAWYAYRNDDARAVAVDDPSLLYDAAVDRTYDYLHSHGGRVDDHYHQSSYQRRVRVYGQ